MTIEEMKNVDVKKVDRDQLADINDVEIDMSRPKEERCARFLEQIGNPFCYKCGGVVVKVRFADTDKTLDDRLEQYIRSR